jgi:hypothetical protein
MGGKHEAGYGILDNGGNAASHISAPLNIASNSRLISERSNNQRIDDLGGLSKS